MQNEVLEVIQETKVLEKEFESLPFIAREVDCYGDVIMCVQDTTTGKIYIGVSWICNGIGLNKSQKDAQV